MSAHEMTREARGLALRLRAAANAALLSIGRDGRDIAPVIRSRRLLHAYDRAAARFYRRRAALFAAHEAAE